MEAFRLSLPAHDIRTRSHTAGDNSHIAFAGTDGSLTRHKDVFAVMRFARHIIVVAIDRLQLRRERTDFSARTDSGDNLLHHHVAIQTREILRPMDRFDIIIEMLAAFREVAKIPVRQMNKHSLHVLSSDLDEVATHSIANSPRTAMEHEPHRIRLIQAHFDEVIAGAKSTQMVRVVAAIELWMLLKDRVIARLERLPNFHVACRDFVPRTAVTFPSMICAALRHRFLDRKSVV